MKTKRKIESGNRILNALLPEERERLEKKLSRRDYALGDLIFRSGDKIQRVVFPVEALGSVVGVTPTGTSAEIGLIGREGLIGADALMGASESVNQIVMQMAGPAFDLPLNEAKKEFALGGTFHDEVLRSVYRLMLQVSQTAVCNRLHTLERRISRWLLMCHDRIEGDTIRMTQEFVSFMVGTNRTGVTKVASELQERGILRYSRGTITILDRAGLVEAACECYTVVAKAAI